MRATFLSDWSADHPWLTVVLSVIITALMVSFIPRIKIDTDPENMLDKSEPIRVFHQQSKKRFSAYDRVLVAVVNDDDPDGVWNPDTLARVHKLVKKIERMEGVRPVNIVAASTVDDIEQVSEGTVRFRWLMAEPPKTREAARHIRDRALANPMLAGTVVSLDKKAMTMYVAIEGKEYGHSVATGIKKVIAELAGPEKYYITGLPVAEDTFGVEMFEQMAVTAPLAGLVVFLLMLFFFRRFGMVVAPMLVAMMSIGWAMGLLIGTGFTVHIMSSMIPIFLMPIAVVDSIHVLSVMFDRLRHGEERKAALAATYEELFWPMLYTSLTSGAGFASLILTPIPPVQVYGGFVAFGIAAAWFLTMTFLPAYVMLLPQKGLQRLAASTDSEGEVDHGRIARWLERLGPWTVRRSRLLVAGTVLVAIISAVGISMIRINDNPTRWFHAGHPIRVAEKVLNERLSGSYLAYLVLEAKNLDADGAYLSELETRLTEWSKKLEDGADEFQASGQEALALVKKAFPEAANSENPREAVLLQAMSALEDKLYEVDDDQGTAMEEVLRWLGDEAGKTKPWSDPAALRRLEKLQRQIEKLDGVGKALAITDVVRKVYQELRGGDPKHSVIPPTSSAVEQSLLTFQSSHHPEWLDHYVTPDRRAINVWVMLRSGDNIDVTRIVGQVEKLLDEEPFPMPVQRKWAGLSYLNVVWQARMVGGMVWSLLGSFVVVFFMMVLLFRSFWWGFLTMVPLTLTIALIYGIIGIVGKDYDMPVAVLSSLTLGLSVDFAIHFLERIRSVYAEVGDFNRAIEEMFREPARAISRNVIVIAIGFVPLLAATLVPYQTVGFFLLAIMLISGVATLMILPALLAVFGEKLLEKAEVTHSTYRNES